MKMINKDLSLLAEIEKYFTDDGDKFIFILPLILDMEPLDDKMFDKLILSIIKSFRNHPDIEKIKSLIKMITSLRVACKKNQIMYDAVREKIAILLQNKQVQEILNQQNVKVSSNIKKTNKLDL
jgi:hypothetical protein